MALHRQLNVINRMRSIYFARLDHHQYKMNINISPSVLSSSCILHLVDEVSYKPNSERHLSMYYLIREIVNDETFTLNIYDLIHD